MFSRASRDALFVVRTRRGDAQRDIEIERKRKTDGKEEETRARETDERREKGRERRRERALASI